MSTRIGRPVSIAPLQFEGTSPYSGALGTPELIGSTENQLRLNLFDWVPWGNDDEETAQENDADQGQPEDNAEAIDIEGTQTSQAVITLGLIALVGYFIYVRRSK